MDHDTLARSQQEFAQRLALVTDAQWMLPTPCDDWDVRGLVNHVVTASKVSAMLVHGASRDETVAIIGTDFLGDDPIAAFARATDEQAAAFKEPGALDMIVPHPAFDMPVTQLLEFRVGDMVLHAWDLATAIGTDKELDPELVRVVWESLTPLADLLPASGAFGEGRSGAVGDDAPLQQRLLDLSGRRT